MNKVILLGNVGKDPQMRFVEKRPIASFPLATTEPARRAPNGAEIPERTEWHNIVMTDKFAEFVKAHPGYKVLSYVNTSAAVKALTDVVVTSGNAKEIVESFPKDEKLIFGPDYNLGNYINSITGRNMLLWNGACDVHERFSVEKIVALKAQYPNAQILAHPECKGAVLKLADYVGSTAALLKYAKSSDIKEFLVATESGILHEMQKSCPEKKFIPVPPDDSTCACNECAYMRLNTMEKLYNCLKYEWPSIDVSPEIAQKAVKPIEKMLEISAKIKR